MKKIAFILVVAAILPVFVHAQNTDETPKQMDIFEHMRKMQREMFKNFGGMSDSTGDNMMRMDSTFSRSFGMLFDGNEWKSLNPNDTTMNDMFRQMEERMSKLGEGFNFSEMFKGFGDMFGEGFDMQTTPMPRVKPKEKERRGEGEKKEKTYSTEKI